MKRRHPTQKWLLSSTLFEVDPGVEADTERGRYERGRESTLMRKDQSSHRKKKEEEEERKRMEEGDGNFGSFLIEFPLS